MMTPLEAIEASPPNVWLTAFRAFEPERHGFLGFSVPSHLDRFVRETRPGVLVAIWATSHADSAERGKLVGILQCSHVRGAGRDFTDPDTAAPGRKTGKEAIDFPFAVRAVRAWKIAPSKRPTVREFASTTFFAESGEGRATFLGSQGDRLTSEEARNLLKLAAEETAVYGEATRTEYSRGLFEDMLQPNRPGPVSQRGYEVEPAEGPKHLYVLGMQGKAAIFLNDVTAADFTIIKPGFSGSPSARCDALNASYPRGSAFRWKLYSSTEALGHHPVPSSAHAIAGERAMHAAAQENGGRSLGNEFFLCRKDKASDVILAGIKAANEFGR